MIVWGVIAGVAAAILTGLILMKVLVKKSTTWVFDYTLHRGGWVKHTKRWVRRCPIRSGIRTPRGEVRRLKRALRQARKGGYHVHEAVRDRENMLLL